MLEAGQYDRNVLQMLTGLIKCVVVDGLEFFNF